MKMVPIEFEIYDPALQESVGTIKMVDEGGAEIHINGVHNLHSWRKLVPLVTKALKQMELEGDEK